jgi:hypothetical protein
LSWLIRRMRVPASESQMGVVLAVCAVTMSSMLWVILWQTRVIDQQMDTIRWLRALVLHG